MALILDGDFADRIAADAFAAGWRACVKTLREMSGHETRLTLAQMLEVADEIPCAYAARLPAAGEKESGGESSSGK